MSWTRRRKGPVRGSVVVAVGVVLVMGSCASNASGAVDADDLPDQLSGTSLSCGPLSSVGEDDFDDDTPGVPDRKIVCTAGETTAGFWVWDSGDVDPAFVQDVLVDRACRFDVDTSYLSGPGWVASATRYIEDQDVNDVDKEVLEELADATGGSLEAPPC